VNAPRTVESFGVWDVILKSAGQLRTAHGVVLGLDFGAILALAAALGADVHLLSECLPAIEAAIVRKMNEQLQAR
jgi:hypothetical protein